MTYKEFCACMAHIDTYLAEAHAADNALQSLARDCYVSCSVGGALLDAYTKLLSQSVGDHDEWVSYYLWECERGAKPKAVSWEENGKRVVIKMRTVADLWRVIQSTADKE